jgi:hypothetical protein
MFVTAQDFNNVEYNVPDASSVAPDGSIVANVKFDNFIVKQEKALLVEILGGEFYEQLVTAINALPAAWVQTISPGGYAINYLVLSSDEHVYKSLVADNVALLSDASSWELQADSIWLLLKNGDTYEFALSKYFWNGIKQMLVPGIYSKWLEKTYDNHSNYGISIANLENATPVSASTRIANGYNEMIRQAGNYCSQRNTLYGYVFQKNLLDARFESVFVNFTSFEAYLNQTFRFLETINIFDL